jgi:two-component system, LytTR family, response regulator AlgR
MAEPKIKALKTLLIDDEPLAIDRMISLCETLENIAIMGAANNGAMALSLIESLKPDLILLDITMPDLDGLEMVKRLERANGHLPVIIFVTAHNDFAVQAFDTPAVDYLLKPISKDRLARAIERAALALGRSISSEAPVSAYLSELWVPHRSELVRIGAHQIDKIEAERDYMRLHVSDRSYLLHQTISKLEEQLDPELFLRVHRSTIIRKDHIARLGHDGAGSWHVDLASGETIRIGRTYLKRVKELAGR